MQYQIKIENIFRKQTVKHSKNTM